MRSFLQGTKSQIAQPYAAAVLRHHLEQCGNCRLDRDNDGIPCKSICP